MAIPKAKPGLVPGGMSETEWQARCELAACYQLVDLYGWSDLSGTHISARVPGTEHFLINPYGLLFDQITASSLLKVDQDGRVLGESDYPFNPAGFLIHSCIHRARPDVHCVLHTHTRAGNAVAMQQGGLLPLHQKALIILGWTAYHEYEGVVLDASEQDRLVASLGDRQILILRNHGLLACGDSVGAAFVWMHRAEQACRFQVDGLAGGVPLHYPSAEVQQKTIEQGLRIFAPNGHARMGMEWPSLLAQLERERGTGYRS